MKKIFYLLCVLAFSGCSIYQPPDSMNQSETRTIIADKKLGQDIRIINTNFRMQKASVTLKNRGARAYKLLIRFYWYAENGLEATPFVSKVHEIRLTTGQQINITEQIPNASVVDFRVEIKE